MNTHQARMKFTEAMAEISQVRFYNHETEECDIKPEVVEICDRGKCDAGSNCCHRMLFQKIPFCVY